MRVDGIPAFVMAARARRSRSALAPSAPRSSLRLAPTPPVPPPAVDVGAVFRSEPREPLPLVEISSGHIAARPHHNIEEVTQAGESTLVRAHSFVDGGPRAYAASYKADGTCAWEYVAPARQTLHAHLARPDGSALLLTRGEDVWQRSQVVSLRPDGSVAWTFQGPSREHIHSIREGPQQRSYVKAGNDVFCLDAKGKKVWKREIPMLTDEFFHVVAPDGTQLFANDNFSNGFGYSMFYGVSGTGKVRQMDLPDIATFPLVVGDRLLVYGGPQGQVHGIDMTRWQGWEVQTDSVRGLQTPFQGKDGNIYLRGRFDDQLYAISAAGQKLWQASVADAAPRFEEPFHVGADGSVHYVKDGEEEIQRLGPDGRAGGSIAVPDGVVSFVPAADGKVYVWTAASSLQVVDAQRQPLQTIPLQIEHPHLWKVRDAGSSGSVVFQSSSDIYHLQADADPYLKRSLQRLESTPPAPSPPPPPAVQRGEDWIIIGGVRVPVRKT